MITQSRLPAAGSNAATEGVSPGFCAKPSANLHSPAKDFHSVISRAYNDRKSAAHDEESRREAKASEASSANKTQRANEADSDTSTDKAHDSDSDKTTNNASSDANSSTATPLDTTLSSTILALLFPQTPPPAESLKPKAVTTGDTSVSSEITPVGNDSGTATPAVASLLEQGMSNTLLHGVLGRKDGLKESGVIKSPSELAKPDEAAKAKKAAALTSANIAATTEKPLGASVDKKATLIPQVVVDGASAAAGGVQVNDLLSGTGSALNELRMKFKAENNTNAGRDGQNVPSAIASDSVGVISADKAVLKTNPDALPAKKDSFDSAMVMDLSGKPVFLDVDRSGGVSAAPVDVSAAHATRVAHLVNQEVTSMRQSGANSLAVSLKVDAHTELSLQLTNHEGQIQASIRCERGNASGLEGHWSDLQASLAKQNVQLLPLDNKSGARNSTAQNQSFSNNSSQFNDSQSSFRRPSREVPQATSTTLSTVSKTTTTKTKSRNTSPQGWESWA